MLSLWPLPPPFFSLSVVVPAVDSLHLVHSLTDRAILFNTLGNVSSLLWEEVGVNKDIMIYEMYTFEIRLQALARLPKRTLHFSSCCSFLCSSNSVFLMYSVTPDCAFQMLFKHFCTAASDALMNLYSLPSFTPFLFWLELISDECSD